MLMDYFTFLTGSFWTIRPGTMDHNTGFIGPYRPPDAPNCPPDLNSRKGMVFLTGPPAGSILS
jgi:hypothetical protein